MIRTIYLPDTNILFNFAESILYEDGLKTWHKNAVFFFENYGGNVEIPSIVWTEFSGLWFHKNIDMQNYDKWFEKHLSVFNQFYLRLKQKHVGLCDESEISYKNIMDCASQMTYQKMSEIVMKDIVSSINNIIMQWSEGQKYNSDENFSKKIERKKQSLSNGKLLDGLDSLIVTFAYEFAKKNHNKKILVVSGDQSMVRIMKSLHKYKDIFVTQKECDIPDNASAVFPWELKKRS